MACSTVSWVFLARGIRLAGVTALAATVMTACGGSSATPVSPTVPSSPITNDPFVSSGPLAYDPDLKAIFQSDCVKCHGSSGGSAGISLTTYAGVMAVVSRGSAQSRLVSATQPDASMYGQFSGDRAGRAAMVKRWVVTYNAAETR
jgi:hypothetical protein